MQDSHSLIRETGMMKMQRQLSLILLAFCLPVMVCSADEIPTLQIKYQIDNEFLRSMVQLSWKQCIKEKEIYQKAKQRNPDAWLKMEQSIKKQWPNYNVDAELAPEPKWSLLAIDTEEEYFAAEKYAKYERNNKYVVSEDGRCEVHEQTQTRANLDNGKFEYIVDLTKKSGIKRVSPVSFRKSVDNSMKQQFGKDTMGEKAANKIVSENHLEKAMVDAGSEKVVDNQTCNYRAPAGSSNTRLCYWSEMSHYPSSMQRPIILKSVIQTGNTTSTKIATSFIRNKEIDEAVFYPDKNINLQDRTQ